MPLLSMDHLPLDAPVISLARFFVKGGEDRVEFQRILDKSRPKIVERTKPFKMVDGWRCDAEEGTQEALVFSGWTSAKDHVEFTAKSIDADPEYGSVTVLCLKTEVRHMSNMEA